MQGVVKVYDPVTGSGIMVLDNDRSEVALRPGSLDGSLFRTLRQGQRIVFEVTRGPATASSPRVRIGSDGY